MVVPHRARALIVKSVRACICACACVGTGAGCGRSPSRPVRAPSTSSTAAAAQPERSSRIRVLIEQEVRASTLQGLSLSAEAPASAASLVIEGVSIEPAIALPEPSGDSTGPPLVARRYLIPAALDMKDVDRLLAVLREHNAKGDMPGIFRAVHVNPEIREVPARADPICPLPAEGPKEKKTRSLLAATALEQRHMDGSGVLLVIVDSPINLQRVKQRRRDVQYRNDLGRTVTGGTPQGDGDPLGHGTKTALLATMMAPKASLTEMSTYAQGTALLASALQGYSKLARLIAERGLFKEFRGIVVVNSWETDDYQHGVHAGSCDGEDLSGVIYPNQPCHSLNAALAALAEAGVDFVFAAGNAGHCSSAAGANTLGSIEGPSGHDAVLSVAAVDVKKRRLRDSGQGPGHLSPQKPDISGYSHLQIYAGLNGQTSTASAIVAGLVAAFRSCIDSRALKPAALFQRIRDSADKVVTRADEQMPTMLQGYDPDFGWGLVNPVGVAAAIGNCPP